MNHTDFQAQINQLDQERQLQKHFPGKHCGAEDCETQCAEALKIARKLNLEPVPFVQNFIVDKIAPEHGCSMPDCTAEILENMRCRFGFVRPETAVPFDDKLDSIRYIFRAGTKECKKCKALNKTIVTEKQAQDEAYMRGKGFYKQKDGVYRPHPHCKCTWEISTKGKSFWEKFRPTAKDIAKGVEYAAVEVLAPQAIGITFDAVKIGTEIITDPAFFSLRIRHMILDYHKDYKKDPVEALPDLELLRKYLNAADWKGMIGMYRKYKKLLEKSKANEPCFFLLTWYIDYVSKNEKSF